RSVIAVAIWLVVSTLAIAAVVAAARRDSADPARCAALVPLDRRCCAEGQRVENGRCVGRPERCPVPLVVSEAGCAVEMTRVFVPGGVIKAGVGDWEAEGRASRDDVAVAPFELDRF